MDLRGVLFAPSCNAARFLVALLRQGDASWMAARKIPVRYADLTDCFSFASSFAASACSMGFDRIWRGSCHPSGVPLKE